VPFSYFFSKHKNNPTGEMKKMLEDFFWRVSLGTRYSSGAEGKLSQDVGKMDAILKGKLPKYEWSIDVSAESLKTIQMGWFGTGRSVTKAILCLYAMQKPKSFDSNQDVTIDNSWLKASTSKNYHHFFPRAYIKKHFPLISYWQCNHILNITIVDSFLNKNTIRAKAPSVYMKTFSNENEEIVKTMKTHLIGDFQRFGILDDDYEKFFTQRAKFVSKELTKRVIPQTTGVEQQADQEDITESDEQETLED